MFATLARRAAQGSKTQSSAEYIRMIKELYPTKKVWPPDFQKLSPQEQLKFEKKFKRRLAIKAERPAWDKTIKLAQLFTVTTVIIYSALFMDWKQEHQPFDGVGLVYYASRSKITS
ncbi:hypothetical protein KVR01_005783 [Diaporthe batatas]|uniref:uncharacterized protein n=1 Tax=Diaporthe batatas TaxID=748121 RepID=UPI001D056BF9|nr:uncharacterized protein KVR01_005783 [Diaporthe batatas]KAG8163865.1 hypothetical protein KVR01_005783 [Diaporthe batatas]